VSHFEVGDSVRITENPASAAAVGKDVAQSRTDLAKTANVCAFTLCRKFLPINYANYHSGNLTIMFYHYHLYHYCLFNFCEAACFDIVLWFDEFCISFRDWSFKIFYMRKQLLFSACLSHRNSVCLSVCHTGRSVRNGAS